MNEKRPPNSGAFVKGVKKPNQGKRGPDKVSLDLKQMILGSLEAVGGLEYLARCAKDPKLAPAYLALVGKILPHTIAGELKISNPEKELADLNANRAPESRPPLAH